MKILQVIITLLPLLSATYGQSTCIAPLGCLLGIQVMCPPCYPGRGTGGGGVTPGGGTGGGSGSTPPADLPTQRANGLTRMNACRSGTNPPTAGLASSPALDASAQAYADYLGANNLFQHDTSVAGREGENLALSCGDPSASVAKAVDAWCGEKSLYCPNGNGAITAANGHYTQNVWKSTTQVGFGMAKRKDGCTVIVARFNPPGNYMGQAAEIGC